MLEAGHRPLPSPPLRGHSESVERPRMKGPLPGGRRGGQRSEILAESSETQKARELLLRQVVAKPRATRTRIMVEG